MTVRRRFARCELRNLLRLVAWLLPLAVLVEACGSAAPSATRVVPALQRVAQIKEGQPVLVFVYTDG